VPNQRRDTGRPGRPVRPVRGTARRTPASARTTGEPARSASRPASARRAAAPGTAKRTHAPQPSRFTGRAATLGLVLVALLLAYAYPMRLYLTQQAEIAALESNQRAQRTRIQDKQTQVAKWNDKDYVIAMLHRRLQMVLPGDKAIVTGVPPGDPDAPTDPQAGQAINTGPWYGKLWSSVQAADKPGTAP
jgi:hypothetical protein